MRPHNLRVCAVAGALLIGACAAPAADRGAPAAPPGVAARIQTALDTAAARYLRTAAALDTGAGIPRATKPDGSWHVTPVNEWTSGFFAGSLWLLHAATGDPALRAQAERWTRPLAAIPRGTYTHDLGFQFLGSFGNAFRFTRDPAWRTPALHAAALLAARFNPTVGAIKSWDFMPPSRPYPVIADNMMNLELLFWGARQPEGDPAWREIALTHARTTLRHHLRPDGGSFHVIIFEPADGRVLERITHQGAADGSTWARGQAWLTYGFAMSYRESGDTAFLGAARRLANYTRAHLPEDRVACWDFQAPGCPATALRDASAAAITASALLELATFVPADESASLRREAASILTALAAPRYIAPAGAAAVLAHAVGNHPAGTEIDVGLVYADYYFIEALLRWRELETGDRRLHLLDAPPPRTHTLRAELLRESRLRLRQGDTLLAPALARLVKEADSALAVGPFTVTAKQRTPPSGDRHDYMSFGPYWWPDSTRPGGLPYVRRDGQVNWELRRESDALRLYAMTDAVETLSLAYYFTGDTRYAARAALLLRTWFLDPATRMNPHLRYGQAIPGVTEGRGIGIIDTRDLGRITDAVTLLDGAPAWTATDRAGMRDWASRYLDWLLTSEHGRDEQDEANNHGTWYDVQVTTLALFTGRDDIARDVLAGSATRRIALHFDSAGRQPLELARTRSLHYSIENLEGHARLAELGRHVGIDLWRLETATGGSIARGLDFLAPYSDPAVRWPFEQITAEAPDLFVRPFLRAATALRQPRHTQVVRHVPESVRRDHRSLLLYPPHPALAP